MNGIQRVTAAIGRTPLDRIPRGELVVEPAFIRKFIGVSKPVSSAPPAVLSPEDEMAVYHGLGLDLVCIHNGSEGAGTARRQRIERFGREGLFVFSLIDGAFQTVMCSQDFAAFMQAVVRTPQQVAEAMQRAAEANVIHIEQDVAAGVHGIIIADDIAYTQGPLVSPAFVERFVLPGWKRQVTAARRLGVPVFFHSDGNLNALLPVIAAAGFQGLQCIEPAAGMDIAAVKASYGHQLCLMGNLDPALVSGDDPPVPAGGENGYGRLKAAVADLMAAGAPGGGFIFGTCSGLHAGMNPEKVRWLYQAADETANGSD